MSTTSRAQIRKPLRTKRNPWVAQPGLAATVERWALKVRAVATRSWQAFVPWFNAQPDHRRLALVVVAFVALIGLLDVAGVGRLGVSHVAPTSQTAAIVASSSARILTAESAPTVPGKAWVATQLWQGSGARVTEPFTVGGHWRVDWLFNPPPAGAILQVFIYSADGALLMDTATNTQSTGADSSFWAGPGTYFLKVNSTGGDWKLDVQDLR